MVPFLFHSSSVPQSSTTTSPSPTENKFARFPLPFACDLAHIESFPCHLARESKNGSKISTRSALPSYKRGRKEKKPTGHGETNPSFPSNSSSLFPQSGEEHISFPILNVAIKRIFCTSSERRTLDRESEGKGPFNSWE